MEKKALTTALWLINIFTALLTVCAVALPWAVTWYVETMGRSQKLPAIIMVTCYPCVPFAGGILFYLRRIIKNASRDMLFHQSNTVYFDRIALFCLVISVVTLIAGKFYLPFLIVGVAFCFFSFMTYVYRILFSRVSNEMEKKEQPEQREE